ncbi:sulfatase-like hydrolase/transferase [Allosphingosinicella sp.]|uniref:sulfatase-like hydrolase/transferase n=1 Tax=Allosphingosinicella sp. TaxID=2823234 RepID=UPI002F0E9110
MAIGGIAIKPILFALYLLTGYQLAAERAFTLGLSLSLLVYALLFTLLAGCLLLSAYIQPFWVRALYAVPLAISAAFLSVCERITGGFLQYDTFLTLIETRGGAGDALEQYWLPLALGAAPSLLLLVAMLWPVRAAPPLHRSVILSAAPVGVAMLAAILYVRGGDGAHGLPGSFTPLAYLGIAGWEAATTEAAERQPVRIAPGPVPANRDIVFIIDESVAGHYLDINHPQGVRSGLAATQPGVVIHNYGLAASVTNCSVGSNLTLRYGGTRENYVRMNREMPSLWHYARAAGFHTVYIDAQRTGALYDHQMIEGELDAVQEFIPLDDIDVRQRDIAAADRVAAQLNNGRADFVIVNKVGAHFPVHDKYPDEYMRYRPALPRGRFVRAGDHGSLPGFRGSPEDWARYRNAYRNTLLWNVGAFFDRLFATADFTGATLVYTSDHGQDLHDDHRSGYTTHCSAEPAMEEGVVPLVVISGADSAGPDWAANFEVNRNRSSHYNIFPTLLAMMGYRETDVAPVYGRSLLQPTRDALTFNSRFHARLGRGPMWRSVVPERVKAPNAAADVEIQAMAAR